MWVWNEGGIVPGETNWDEAERFLSNLSLKIDTTRDEIVPGTDGTSPRRREFVIYAGDATKTYMVCIVDTRYFSDRY